MYIHLLDLVCGVDLRQVMVFPGYSGSPINKSDHHDIYCNNFESGVKHYSRIAETLLP